MGQSGDPSGAPARPVDTTFVHFKEALAQAKEQGNASDEAKIDLKIGEYFYGMGLYAEAMDHYNQALELLSGSMKDTLYLSLNNNMGKVYLSQHNYPLAKHYFEDALNGFQQLRNTKGMAVSQGFLGACYEKMGEYEKALQCQKQSLQLFQNVGDTKGVSTVNENIGSIYEDLAQYRLAHDYFVRAHQGIQGDGTDAEANVLNNLGDVQRKQGHYEEALEFTERALAIADSLDDYHQLESAHKDLAKTYLEMEDYKMAYNHLAQSLNYNSERLQRLNSDQLNILQAIYETTKKENQIQLLREQNKVGKARLNLLWVVLFSVVALLVGLYSYRGRKRKAKIKIQEYRQRTLRAELERKEVEEQNLQHEIQLKTAALSRYSLHLSQKNKILLDLSNTLKNIAARKNMDAQAKMAALVKEIEFNLQHENEWDEFMSFFMDIHPDFIKKLSARSNKSLSPTELRLGMLLRLNMSSKEIADVLRVTPDSVRVARHRLRKKLPIDQKEELVNYLIEL